MTFRNCNSLTPHDPKHDPDDDTVVARRTQLADCALLLAQLARRLDFATPRQTAIDVALLQHAREARINLVALLKLDDAIDREASVHGRLIGALRDTSDCLALAVDALDDGRQPVTLLRALQERVDTLLATLP